ncbi:peptidase C25-like protein [Algoriphagus ratkowskyi]|uniref:Peptidase C25-like protein n=1 Tax=Algoriphagus ratkowskyi TaxID=57028 RepID=A0A2W7T7P5_9BACT|nr:type IX secretion system sortase PorU [Algoriphagus ratkowskyi]PZX59252.1 peptidase C25-like protein [Algoriphagus ratkowskyi]TXD77472.1 type IX secretion system sortase PorU [Algoriphagus ratkowskyi]
MITQCQKLLFFLLFCFLLIESASGQNSFFKFKIQEEGIYKISASNAQMLGINSLSEVAVYGYPGMLPQVLQPENLVLQEIPGLEKDGNLYFYLSAPSSYEYNKDSIAYHPNQYADSISFLIGVSRQARRITTIGGQPGELPPATLYQWNWLKEDQNNILNSGRAWYSRAVAPGVTRGYSFPLETEINAEWKIVGKVMGRSSAAAKIFMAVDDLNISESSIDGIPNSTYAIKGQEVLLNESFSPAGNKVDRLRISFQASNPNDAGYFEYLGIGVPHSSNSLKEGVYSLNQKSSILLAPLAGLSAWEVSDYYVPKAIDFNSGSELSGQKFIVFNEKHIKEISQLKPANLSLRTQSVWPDFLLIAPRLLSNSAEKLSLHKVGMGIYSEVAYLDEIYDAFGYGNSDLNAIRNFLAWHYHKGAKLKNVLILGKGTFDYKSKLGGRPNLVPIYTSRNSLNPLTTYSSDDYFTLLEFGQGEWEESRSGDELMKIGVGRLPVINAQEAKLVVDKIIDYESNPKTGDWKKTVTFFADDGDNNIHLRDSEAHASFLTKNHKEYKQEKLYLDRFEQEKTGERQSSAQAKSALEETLERGTLLLNYIGHGNETTLTAEEVFLTSDIPNWAKQKQLALWVTATCEFGRHDSPYLRSAAEELLIAPNKGAIGLLTTGRPVFSSVNFSLNEAFIAEVFRLENEFAQDLGSIFRNTKNKSQNGSLNRNFSLLADPSMRLATPTFKIEFTSFTDPENQNPLDTLSALQEVTFEALVINPSSGGIAANFNGNYTIELHDKPAKSKTLGDENTVVEFQEEKILLFRGTGTITSGLIKGKLIIPKNIDLEYGDGSIRILGESQAQAWEAFGFDSAIIGGISSNFPKDREGPKIRVVFGGKESPPYIFPSTSIRMKATFSDTSGVNISGLIPAENLTVQINQNTPNQLNKIYIAENNTFTSGIVDTRLVGLKEGKNLVTVRAWDNLGNESVLSQEIIVRGSDEIQILHHKTYPNPTQIESHFELEHNRPGENLMLTLAVYQTDGKILYSEDKRLVKADTQIVDLSWFFLQRQTKYPAKGTYIYKLTLQSELDNSTDSVSGLIMIQ